MQYIQYLIIILVIGGPIIGRVLQALDKKQKQRKAEKEAATRQHEALRTGRTTTPSTQISIGRVTPAPTNTPTRAPTSAAERMQELARKRQQQLEALRSRQQAARQQQASRQQPGRQPTTTTTQTARSPQGRPTQPPTRSPRRPAPRPTPKPTPRFVAPKPAPPKRVSLRESMHADDSHDLPLSTHSRTVAPVTLMGKTMTAEDWRRFIIARELLQPPLAIRHPDEGQVL